MAPTFDLLPLETGALTRRPDFDETDSGHSGSGLMESRATSSCRLALMVFDRVVTVLVIWPLEEVSDMVWT